MKKAGIITGVLALGVGAYFFFNKRMRNKLGTMANDLMDNFNDYENN